MDSEKCVSAPLSPQSRELLTRLEAARDRIARSLVREYHDITGPDLNFAIVSSILQGLFLRTGEECGFIETGTLGLLIQYDGIAGRMARACSEAGLRPDTFFETGPRGHNIVPDTPDEPLREILTFINSQDFPVPIVQLPLEELVGVLEHFLGTRMMTAEGCRVKRTGKSAMLYTGAVDIPSPAVIEYVVSATAGESTENAAGDNGRFPTVLDPACGAGLFLLAAFRSRARRKPPVHFGQIPAGDVAGHSSMGSVFGTDIDPESVSAARFILLLATLEESLRSGAGLPSPHQISGICACLKGTIRCGNALIAPDYFSTKPVFPFNAEERWKVNPFDWREAFPEIIASGGFDAVIGAPPPYRPFAVQAREEYLQTHYHTYAPSAGLYGYFIERGLSLLRPGGILAVLVPQTFLRARHARPLRRLLLSRQIEQITRTGNTRRLQDSEAPVYVLSLCNLPPARPFIVSHEPGGTRPPQNTCSGTRRFTLDQRVLSEEGWNLEDTREADLLKKILGKGTFLDDYILGQVEQGTHHIRKNPLVVDAETRNRLTKGAWWCRRNFISLLRPADIRRYVPVKPGRFIISIKNHKDLRKCRALSEYLEPAAKPGAFDTGPDLPEDGRNCTGLPAENFTIFPKPEHPVPKIIFSPCQQSPAFCYDPQGIYAMTTTLLAIPRDDPFLAAVLNSMLGRFIIRHTFPKTDRGFCTDHEAMGKFPFYVPDFEKLADKTRHGKIVSLVAHLLSLYDYLARARTDQERRLVQQEIDATDVRIDALVFEMYGLTQEEIAVVEANSARTAE